MKDPLQKTKVVIRHLPPSISQSDLFSQIDARFADRYSWFALRPGKSSHKNLKYSRAYIDFKTPEDVCEFAGFFNGHVFVSEKGAQFKTIVEYSPSQHVPKPCGKKDIREGTIFKDPDYLEFLKVIVKPVENLPSAEIQLERKEAEQLGIAKEAPIVTPLMEFIRQKRAAEIGPQGFLDAGKLSRRARAAAAGKPGSRSSKRSSEKKKYVEKDSLKHMSRKAKSAYVARSRQDDQQVTSSGKEMPENEDGSLPGIALTMDSGKKKILLLKAKDRDNPPIETTTAGGSSGLRQSQKHEIGEKLIRGILLKNDAQHSQSSLSVQSEQNPLSSNTENSKRPPRPANARADDKSAGKDHRGSAAISEKHEKRVRNKDRPDRVVWAPLRRVDAAHISEDNPSSSAVNNGEVRDETSFRRIGEVMASSGHQSHSLENGSSRHMSRRGGGHVRKEDVFVEGKSPRRGGSSPNPHEKQMWVQKSSLG